MSAAPLVQALLGGASPAGAAGAGAAAADAAAPPAIRNPARSCAMCPGAAPVPAFAAAGRSGGGDLPGHPDPARMVHLVHLETTLARPSPSVRWGLQISLFAGAHLVVGRADEGQIRSLTAESRVSALARRRVGGPQQDGSSNTQGGATNTQGHRPSFVPLPLLQPLPYHLSTELSVGGGLSLAAPHLQSGDLVVSLDGLAIAAPPFNGCLNAATAYLRSRTAVRIAAFRSRGAMAASAAALVRAPRKDAARASGGGIDASAAEAYAEMVRVLGLRGGAQGGAARPVPHPRKRPYRRRQNRRPRSKPRARTQPPPTTQEIVDYDPLDALDGTRAHLYLNPLIQQDFPSWIASRKVKWRRGWKVTERLARQRERREKYGNKSGRRASARNGRTAAWGGGGDGNGTGRDLSAPFAPRKDFWVPRGHITFQHWLQASKVEWAETYSWRRAKRRKIEQDLNLHTGSGGYGRGTERLSSGGCSADGVESGPNTGPSTLVRLPPPSAVGAPPAQLGAWLDVRKSQWRLLTRKRQREKERERKRRFSDAFAAPDEADRDCDALSFSTPTKDLPASDASSDDIDCTNGALSFSPNSVVTDFELDLPTRQRGPYLSITSRSTSTEIAVIDSIIEDEERRRRELQERKPLDIAFLFDASIGAPDDAVANILSYLHMSEHWKFLCVSSSTSLAIQGRDHLWRALCPSSWTLPRRPRVAWHRLYINKILVEEESSRKQSDGVLLRAQLLIEKGDHCAKLEKLLFSARKRADFDVDYTSGVVCERNSLLNLAVINGRVKIARYLVEQESASIETVDRGNFSPLLNAAWAGNRYMVRYMLGRGASRTLVGRYHSSRGIAPADFSGYTAEGWARVRGHEKLADLIRIGL